MNKHEDILFKLGLAFQLVLIPVAFLWHFSSEANYYNWVVTFCFGVIVLLFFWPQVIKVRLNRLRAIKLQSLLVVLALIISWGVFLYFHNFTRANCLPSYQIFPDNSLNEVQVFLPDDLGKNCNFDPPANFTQSDAFYSVNVLGISWTMLLSAGISIQTAMLLSLIFLALPGVNVYRFILDKKRIRGIKKEELFT